MLKEEGTLPPGYTDKRRRLVKVELSEGLPAASLLGRWRRKDP